MWCGRKVQLLELHDDLIDGHILSNLAADLRVYKALVMKANTHVRRVRRKHHLRWMRA
jgi:hypothetical protein